MFRDPTGHYADLTSLQMTGFVVSTTARMAIPSIARYIVAVVAGTALALTSGDTNTSVEDMRRRGKAIMGETAGRVRAAKVLRHPDAEAFLWPTDFDEEIEASASLNGYSSGRMLEEMNFAWIMSVMARRLILIDIGYDNDRESIGWFYIYEQEWTRGYPLKVYEKFPGQKHPTVVPFMIP